MDPLVIAVLLVIVVLALLGGYLGWGRGEDHAFRYMAQASCLVAVVLLIPALVGVLVLQRGAEDRLRGLGVTPHPAARHVIGAAVGIGDSPVWLFRSDSDPGALLGYYRDPETRPSWEIASPVSERELWLEREGRRIWISAARDGEGSVLTYRYLP